MKARFALSFAVSAAVAVSLAAAPAAASADASFTPVRVNKTLAVVPGAFAAVERHGHGVTIFVHDVQLTPSTKYQEVAVVFNNPSACTHPTPASLCTPGADSNATTGFAFIPLSTTFTTNAAGRANFAVNIPSGTALTNPKGAEVALVYRPASGPGVQHILMSDPQHHGDGDDTDRGEERGNDD